MGHAHTKNQNDANKFGTHKTGSGERLPSLWPTHTERCLDGRLLAEAAPRVLLVEDDDDLRALMKAFLESEGYRVIACRDGFCAFEAFQKGEEIDLLISDLEMPRMKGDRLALEITQVEPTLPVLLMSGSELSQDLRSLIRDQGWLFVAKPFYFSELLFAIHQLVGKLDRHSVVSFPLAQ